MQTRRKFIQIVPVAGAALLAGREVLAQTRPADAADPKNHANIQYVEKSAKADQKCGNCLLYQGKASDAWAACPLVGNKKVPNAGWCSAWAKKG